MKPWERLLLTDEQIQIMYREWGVFYTQKQKLNIAADYYDKSLELRSDPKALYNRSRCKRNIAQTEKALKDAYLALASEPLIQPYNIEVCDGLYQLNQFENAKSSVFNYSLKFKGRKLQAFNDRHNVINLDFAATLGDTLGLFILSNEKYFYLAHAERYKELNVDTRPLWKILREQEKCDVLSIIPKEEELICKREVARRRRIFNLFNQIYMQRSWVDVLYLRALTKDPNLLLSQSKGSRPLLEQLTSNKYHCTKTFLKMLHARSPMYNMKVRSCPNKKLAKKQTEDYLSRVQYQVHRDMMTVLKKIRQLREAKRLEELSAYVEEVMGDYVVLKTHRLMPWKCEFLNEVYNLLALAYIDLYIDIPKNLNEMKRSNHLHALLKMPLEKDKEAQTFVFGDKSTYQDEDTADLPLIRHKRYMTRMEKRIYFAKYPIEKSYAWHAIANAQLKFARFDECCIAARKSIEEARQCNSLIWELLGYLMNCKSHSVLRKIEKIQETLAESISVVKEINNPKITGYMRLLRLANNRDMREKKAEELRKMKAFQSRASND